MRHILPAASAALLLGLSLALSFPAGAQGQQFHVGDRVHIGLNGDNGTIVEILTALANGGVLVKIKRDSNGFVMTYDTMVAAVTMAGGGQAPAAPQAQRPAVPPQGQRPGTQQPATQPPAQGGGTILPGSYECWTGTGGPLHAAMSENFTIVDGSNYRDTSGAPGTYTFSGGNIAFHGGALDGQTGTYSMPSNPPTRNRPPSVTIRASGDACDLRM
ncbi:MAG TPA: hypothetical protein VMI56_17465 [Reyranella sp.]|nr:hypothetical protein [Reyranella sp.]